MGPEITVEGDDQMGGRETAIWDGGFEGGLGG